MSQSDDYVALHEKHMRVCNKYNMAIVYLEGAIRLLRAYTAQKKGDQITLDKKTADFLARFDRWNTNPNEED